ncbi:MAG: site-2 protease family protein [Anaerolineales bacterium]
MNRSFKLWIIRGINVRMHITFPLILVWAALQFGVMARGGIGGAIMGLIAILILFVIVLLHELGHSLAAQHYDVEVKQIVLLPIGGVAELARIPENPKEEFVIAIAGPVANVFIAFFMIFLGLLAGFDLGISRTPLIFAGLSRISVERIFDYVFVSNLFLLAFNLIPAFPLDGGRMFRAFLASRMSYVRATVTAGVIGQGLALLLGVWGLRNFNLIWIFIAVFIYVGASHERKSVRIRSRMAGVKVSQAYSKGIPSLYANSTVLDALGVTRQTSHSHFSLNEGDQYVGLISREDLIDAVEMSRSGVPLRELRIKERPAIHLQDDLREAQSLLDEYDLTALPVIESGKFLGLLSVKNIEEALRLTTKPPHLRPHPSDGQISS